LGRNLLWNFLVSVLYHLSAMSKISLQAKVDAHFSSEKPDWQSFEKNLRSGAFREAVLRAEQSDPKLKKYVKTFGAYQGSKDVVAELKSQDSGTTYKVKDLHNGRLGCNCRDWQYIHSIKGGDCKHIKSLKKSGMLKTSMVRAAIRAAGQVMRLDSKTKKLKAKGEEAKAILRARPKMGVPFRKQLFSWE
jgi:hypothetical protein